MPTNNLLPTYTNAPNKVIAVVGPTGSGKTATGTAIAKALGGVIISADSRQVYRGLDIGTNKEGVPGEWQGLPARIIEGIPQLLVDVAEAGTKYTLHDWLQSARMSVEAIHAAGKLPIVVGGTGLYVSALLEGYALGEGRYAKLKEEPTFASLVIMSDIDRGVLYERSDERFERIFDDLVGEVERLVARGITHDWLQSIGLDYRFASYYLTRQMNREIAIAEFQQSSRHYIRRQLTWWRHHGRPQLCKSVDDALTLVRKFATG